MDYIQSGQLAQAIEKVARELQVINGNAPEIFRSARNRKMNQPPTTYAVSCVNNSDYIARRINEEQEKGWLSQIFPDANSNHVVLVFVKK